MILGAEIVLLIYGIYAIVKGSFNIGKGRNVTGTNARILGFIALSPFPIAVFAGIIIGFFYGFLTGELPNQFLLTGLECTILLVVILAVSILGKRFYEQQEAQAQPTDLSEF